MKKGLALLPLLLRGRDPWSPDFEAYIKGLSSDEYQRLNATYESTNISRYHQDFEELLHLVNSVLLILMGRLTNEARPDREFCSNDQLPCPKLMPKRSRSGRSHCSFRCTGRPYQLCSTIPNPTKSEICAVCQEAGNRYSVRHDQRFHSQCFWGLRPLTWSSPVSPARGSGSW